MIVQRLKSSKNQSLLSVPLEKKSTKNQNTVYICLFSKSISLITSISFLHRKIFFVPKKIVKSHMDENSDVTSMFETCIKFQFQFRYFYAHFEAKNKTK